MVIFATSMLSATPPTTAIAQSGALIIANSNLVEFNSEPGIVSDAQSYTISGSGLSADILISSPEGFELSADGSIFGPTLTLPPTDGIVDNATVYVRLISSAIGTLSGDISHTSEGAAEVTLTVAGTVTEPTATETVPPTETATATETTTPSETVTPTETAIIPEVKALDGELDAAGCSTVALTATEDTYLSAGDVTYNNGGNTTIHVNTTTGTDRRAALLKWDLSSIPTNATVSSANVKLNVTDSSTLVYNMYSMRQTWVEGSSTQAASTTSANWNTYNGSTSWGTVGAASTSTDRYDSNMWSATTSSYSSTGSKTIDLNSEGIAVLQGWVNGSLSNYGVTLQNYSSSSANTFYFSSSENSTAANRPILNVTYCVASTTPTITTVGTLTAFSAAPGVASTAQTYTVAGEVLSDNLIITAPTGFELSKDGSAYSSSLSYIPSSGTVATSTVYVRLAANAEGAYSGNLAHTSTGATQVDIAVTGTVSNTTCTDVALVASEDTYMSSVNTENNYGGVNLFKVSSNSSTDRGALLKWDLSSIPSNATVSTASMKLYVSTAASQTYNLYSMRRSWVEGTLTSGGASTTSANWETYNGTNTWGTSGAANTTSDRFNTNLWGAGSSTFSSTGSKTVTLNADALTVLNGWIANSSTNYGLTIQNYSASSSSNDLQISSSENSTTANRPTLNLNYCVSTTPIPTITTSGTLTAFSSQPGVASAYQTYNISGTNLIGDITVTAPTGFQISKTSGGTYGSTLTFSPSGGTLASSPVYVQLYHASAGSYGGNITHISSGATTKNVAASGTVAVVSTTDQIIFGSDMHQSTDNLNSLLDAIFADGVTAPNLVALGGDYNNNGSAGTAYNSSVIDAAITGVFTTEPTKRYVTGNNDANSLGSTGNFAYATGEMYKDSNILVYGMHEYDFPTTVDESDAYDIGVASTDELETYLTNLSTADKAKVIFIVTHVPLHVERGDNPEGYYMAKMLNDVITAYPDLDIVYITGHNHTDDCSDVLVQRGASGNFNNNGSSNALTIKFTYMNAGYINGTVSNSSCVNKGMLATTTPTTITLQRYIISSGNLGTSEVVTRNSSTTPTIVTSGTLSAFNTVAGVASAAQSYTVSGTNLSAAITVTAPANFQVSLASSSGFGSTVSTSAPSGGTVASTPIYVRYNPSVAGTSSGSVTNASTGATTQNVAVSGNSVPTISTVGTLSAFSTTTGVASAYQTYTVSGINLSGNITITAPDGYELSSNDGIYTSSLTLTPVSNVVTTSTIYVRLFNAVNGTYNGNITHASSGATTVNVAVTGTVSTVSNAAPNAPTIISPANGATGVSTPPTLSVTATDPNADTMSVSFYGHPASTSTADDFMIVLIPDIQNESQSNTAMLTSQANWLVNNKETENIVFATTLGDTVNTSSSATQYGNADAAFDIVDAGGVWYTVAPGNHDIAMGSTIYSNYFGVSRYASHLYSNGYWFGGSYDDYNTYSLFTADGMDFILINLQYSPTTAILNWADGLLATYSSRRAIVEQHDILNTNDTWITSGTTTYNALRDHSNLFMMVCGHMHSGSDGAAYVAGSNTVDGGIIHVVQADYQDISSGNGYLRLLRFSPANSKIYMTTYSPYTLGSITTSPDQMELAYDMSSAISSSEASDFTLIGTDTDVASGSTASVSWSGLDESTKYEWYAVATDPGGLSGTSPIWNFTTASGANTQPVITEGTSTAVTMSEDSSPTAFSKTLNATDADGDTLTWSISSAATNGTASASGTGLSKAITYTPTANFNGSDSFIVQVSDGNGGTDTITVNVTIQSVNDVPVITEGASVAVTMSEDGSPTAFSKTLNVTDVDTAAASLTWSISGAATNGTASASGTGLSKAITYTPTANYNGSDSFIVQVSDGAGGTDTITVNVTISAVNDTPVATAQTVSTNEDTAKSITLSGTDVEGTTLTYSVVNNPSIGVLTGTAPDLTYTPNSNANGGDSFTFTVSDGVNTSAAATITVNVTPVNDAPVITEGTSTSVTMSEDGSPTAFSKTLNVTDLDALSNSLTWSISTAASHGTASASGTGLSKAITYTPAANYNGSDSFVVQVSDGDGGTDTITVNVTIESVNDAPVITEGATTTVSMSSNGSPTAFALTLNATDTDLPADTLSWSISTAALHGTAGASGNGASKAIIYTPEADYEGTDTFVVQVSDGALTDTITVTVNISAATYQVSVTVSGTGSVVIASDPAGISCTSGTCSASFANGSTVTLTATPASAYYRLKNWSGDCTGTGTCSLSVTSAKAVTANIETSSFTDVPFNYTETFGDVDYLLYPYIEALYDAGFTSGCSTSPLKYCPGNNLTRAEAAVFNLRAVNGTTYTPTLPNSLHFTADIYTSENGWAQAWTESMFSTGLSSGCGTLNSYCPWTNLARDEAAVFALRIKHGMTYNAPAATGLVFGDLTNTSYWGTAWAEQAYAEGLLPSCGTDPISGKPNICATQNVSRGLSAYMIVKAKNLTLPE